MTLLCNKCNGQELRSTRNSHLCIEGIDALLTEKSDTPVKDFVEKLIKQFSHEVRHLKIRDSELSAEVHILKTELKKSELKHLQAIG